MQSIDTARAKEYTPKKGLDAEYTPKKGSGRQKLAVHAYILKELTELVNDS